MTFRSAKVNKAYDLKQAQKLVRKYLPAWKVLKHPNPGSACCYVDAKKISLGIRSPLWIVCHEIAHGLVQERKLPLGHHEAFRQIYVDTVRKEMGPYWANKLAKNFREANLLVCHPGEQPLGMMDRLAARVFSALLGPR